MCLGKEGACLKKLIELSVRGSRYYLFAEISSDQLKKLQQFTSLFYESNYTYHSKNDDALVQQFLVKAGERLDMNLELVDIETVLVIK